MTDTEAQLEALLVDSLIGATSLTPVVEVNHSARAHAILSASGTYRWWNCPGSITLTRGMHSASSKYAEEGTAAHEVANLCLEQGMDAIEMAGRMIGAGSHEFEGILIEIPGVEVTIEMAEAVQVYLDKCRSFRAEDGWECYYERRFTLARFNPPCDMFGTADFIAVNRKLGLLAIVDYKHGQGITVEAEGNPQLRYYGLGALCALPDDVVIENVEMHIVQPRGRGEPIKTARTMGVVALMEWSIELIERARYALDPSAPLEAGTWCRFCPASGRCPAQTDGALRVAQNEFDAPSTTAVLESDTLDLLALMDAGKAEMLPARRTDQYPDPLQLAAASPCEVRLLSHEQVGALLFRLDRLEEWVKALRQAAQAELEAGGVIPGWALKPTRPSRVWPDDNEQLQAEYLALAFGIPEDKLWTRKLISPAQAEVVIAEMDYAATGGTKAAAKTRAKEALNEEWESRSSGFNLTPASDTHPAPAGRGSEFDTLPAIQ